MVKNGAPLSQKRRQWRALGNAERKLASGSYTADRQTTAICIVTTNPPLLPQSDPREIFCLGKDSPSGKCEKLGRIRPLPFGSRMSRERKSQVVLSQGRRDFFWLSFSNLQMNLTRNLRAATEELYSSDEGLQNWNLIFWTPF